MAAGGQRIGPARNRNAELLTLTERKVINPVSCEPVRVALKELQKLFLGQVFARPATCSTAGLAGNGGAIVKSAGIADGRVATSLPEVPVPEFRVARTASDNQVYDACSMMTLLDPNLSHALRIAVERRRTTCLPIGYG